MTHVSTLTLHRLRVGELDAAAAEEARVHLEGCERCAARLRAQQAHREQFVLSPVPAELRTPEAPPKRRWAWFFALVPVCAALLFFVSADPLRTKGEGALLEAWLDTTEGPLLLDDGALVHAGDTIQLRFSSDGRPWASFGGVDATGAVEVYGTWNVEGDGIETAPFALTLDQVRGKQRFYALFTPARPAREDVERAFRIQQAPQGGILRTLALEKR